MDVCPIFVEHPFDDRGVRPRRAEDELASVQRSAFDGISQGFAAAVDEGGREGGIEGFRVFFGEDFAEDVVSGRGEAVGAHAAVVGVFVFGLPGGGEADDEVAWVGRWGREDQKCGSKNLA